MDSAPCTRSTEDACPLCETPVFEEPHDPDYCDACGCLLVGWSARDTTETMPASISRRSGEASADPSGNGEPYRGTVEGDDLDVLVAHRRRRFRASTASVAVFVVGLASRLDVPTSLLIGIGALAVGGIAWSLLPVPTLLRFVATTDSLTVVPDGVPLHRGRCFRADDIDGLFVRALARADRPEDRRLELLLLDGHGARHTLLRGLDDPATLSWLADHIEHALGYAPSPA